MEPFHEPSSHKYNQSTHNLLIVLKSLIDANVEAVDNVLRTIERLSDECYCQPVGERSQPGAHIRHILDHYRAVKEGLASGVVDYDYRRRQCLAETDRSCAIDELRQVRAWLLEVLTPGDTHLVVKSEVSLCDCCEVSLPSDLNRELLYVLNHTVHHMAYLSLLLQLGGISTDANVGIAPATATHRRTALAS